MSGLVNLLPEPLLRDHKEFQRFYLDYMSVQTLGD